MSAPDTHIEKQKTRHSPALIGIGLAAAFGLGMLFANFGTAVDDTEGAADLPAGAADIDN